MRSKDKRIHIVGAGLAGLVAAINLAKEGREIVVYEKGKRVGGMASYNPSPHGTPMDVDAMCNYIDIDIRPALYEIPIAYMSIWGKRYGIKFPKNAPGYMIERGPRKTSIDRYLYEIATDLGVEFKFDHPISTDRQINELPRGSIVATGLHLDGYTALDMPYKTLYGYFAKGRVPWNDTKVTVYFDNFSPDYAFTCSVNGIAFALIFNRHRPVAKWEMEKFKEMALGPDGYNFKKFQVLEGGAAPVKYMNNPRLFQGESITVGTVGGVMDPILFFGMHGALLSGKVAAMAVNDRAVAYKEWKRLNRTFKPVLMAKRLIDNVPRDVLLKYPMQLGMALNPVYSRWLVRQGFKVNVTGYGRI